MDWDGNWTPTTLGTGEEMTNVLISKSNYTLIYGVNQTMFTLCLSRSLTCSEFFFFTININWCVKAVIHDVILIVNMAKCLFLVHFSLMVQSARSCDFSNDV